MKLTTATVLLLLFARFSSSADAPDQFSRIRIFVPDRQTLNKVWQAGVDYEGVTGKPGGWMEFIVGEFEKQELTRLGLSFQATPASATAMHTAEPSLESTMAPPTHFHLGTMGGFLRFDEVIAELDSMKQYFPSIISVRESTGVTHENRAIWAVKISDNPTLAESSEPEVLYTALHHAREPAGMMTVVYYMWWLLENYGTDPTATYLVNNRQMWFIPVVNPDGYVHNQSLYTPPSGFGFWRKNRRNNGDGTRGVDLNRNYGSFDMWNAPNGGSSTATGSDTYRGIFPFSEPETQAIDFFMRSHEIKTCLNYHTYGRYLIYPWGYLSTESDDSTTYREFGLDMTSANRYTSGTDQQTVGYSTRGNSDDYMFGDLSKPRTYAMTPEVGTSFWPASSSIVPYAEQNLEANKYLAHIAGHYTVATDFSITDTEAENDLDRNEAFTLSLTLKNKGLIDATNLSVTVTSSIDEVPFSQPVANVSSISARETIQLHFDGITTGTMPLGTEISFFIEVTDGAGYFHTDTLQAFTGQRQILFTDDANSGLGYWAAGSPWGTSTEAHSAPASFAESPIGQYAANTDASLRLASAINLVGYKHIELRYWTKWAIEPTWDMAFVEVSTNGGTNWTSVKGTRSRAGSGSGVQALGLWGYDNYSPGLEWMQERVDLSSFKNNQIMIRFRFTSDGGEQRDGWYVDDIELSGYRNIAQFTPLSVTNNGAEQIELSFGESALATSAIDSELGEEEIGTPPGAGQFDARWRISGTNGTLMDLRDTLSNSNTENIFVLDLQEGSGGYPLTVQWNPGTMLPGSWKIRDEQTSGSLIAKNMWESSELTITNPTIHALEIIHSPFDSASLQLAEKWNLISLPIEVNNPLSDDLLPNALSAVFAYEGSYVAKDTLEAGRAYWVKYPSAQTYMLYGTPLPHEVIALPSGWSMIGGLTCNLPLSHMNCNPGPCPTAYVYSNGYQSLDTIPAGQGFWMKGPRTLTLSCYESFTSAQKLEPSPSASSLAISDRNGNRQVLYFGNKAIWPSRDAELPPVPPAGAFDVRFASGSSFGIIESETTIDIQATEYPLTLSWVINDEANSRYIVTSEGANGEPIFHQSIMSVGSAIISDPSIRRLTLSVPETEELPTAFKLHQNFPNPFNPSTTIRFDLPQPARVTLAVFNGIGQKVTEVLSGVNYSAGTFSQIVSAGGLSSGTYYLRLTAIPLSGGQPVVKTQTILFIQ